MEKIAYRAVVALALINFIVFGILTLPYGGSVPEGSVFHSIAEQGPYFLDSRGQLTEVSRRVYVPLVWGSRIFVMSLPTMMIWGLWRRLRRPAN
jgi:hypothetical protein